MERDGRYKGVGARRSQWGDLMREGGVGRTVAAKEKRAMVRIK